MVTKVSIFAAALSALLSFHVQAKDCDESAPCIVKVTPVISSGECNGGKADPVKVTLAHPKAKKHIVWRLPRGYQFCAGDGVSLKSGDGADQFDSMYATDDPNGSASGSGACKQHYHWRALHTISRPGDPYEYKIIFRDVSGQKRYCIDPSIVNG